MSPITVETTIAAPIEKVWQYFTDPGHITKWYFASDEWHAPAAENDLRVGGTFKIKMAAKDGSFGFDFEGKYTEIQLEKLIIYQLGDAREVTTTFDGDKSSTKVIQTFDPENHNPIEMQKGGWQAILDSFKKYTEAN
jgi:uncharacterized protein YndB with AHSA1/START domain